MRAVAALALLAACRAPAPATPPAPDNEVAAPAAPFYAALFEPGAAWQFDVEQLDSDYDEHDQFVDRVEHFVLACHVEAVDRAGDVTTSEVACDDAWPTNGGDMPLRGTWVMSPRGLWMSTIDGAPMIANPPERWVTVEDDEAGEPISELSLGEQGDGWCWSAQYMQGDSSWSRLCFDAHGPTEGGYGWSGGSEHATSFTLVR